MNQSPDPDALQSEEPTVDARDEQYKQAVELVYKFRDELIALFRKSQESFETQLSFISAGALALSVGFIKNIVTPFDKSIYKGLLGWGWGLLITTLLLNCISHMIAAQNANKAIKEINDKDYEPVKIERRNKSIVTINWITIGTMILGITLILLYIIFNTITSPYVKLK